MIILRKLKRNLKEIRKSQYALNTIIDYFEMNNLDYAITGEFITKSIDDHIDSFSGFTTFTIFTDMNKGDLIYILKYYSLNYNTFDNCISVQDVKSSYRTYKIDICFCDLVSIDNIIKKIPLSIDTAIWIPKRNTIKLYNSLDNTVSFNNSTRNGNIAKRLIQLYNFENCKLDNDCAEYVHNYKKKSK